MTVPIRFVAPGRCLARQPLEPGEVIRVPALNRTGRTPLVGYHVACPACGARRIELHDEVRFEEGPPTELHAVVETSLGTPRTVSFWAPSTLASGLSRCPRCNAHHAARGRDFVLG